MMTQHKHPSLLQLFYFRTTAFMYIGAHTFLFLLFLSTRAFHIPFPWLSALIILGWPMVFIVYRIPQLRPALEWFIIVHIFVVSMPAFFMYSQYFTGVDFFIGVIIGITGMVFSLRRHVALVSIFVWNGVVLLYFVLNPYFFFSTHYLNPLDWIIGVGTMNIVGAMLMLLKYRIERIIEQLDVSTQHTRQKTEELDAVLNNIDEGLIITDAHGVVQRINLPATEMINALDPSQMVGRAVTDVLHLQDAEGKNIVDEQHPITQVIMHHVSLFTTNVTDVPFLVLPDSRRIPLSIIATPLLRNDQLIGVILLLRDVTDEYEIASAKTEFVSLAAHQLRTPLTSIRWYTDLFVDEHALTGVPGELTENIRNAGNALASLVQQLLNVSRLDSGTFIIEPETTSVQAALSALQQQLQPMLLSCGVSMDMQVTGDDAWYVDPSLFHIVLLKVIHNAVVYSRANSTVTVALHKNDSGCTITVADHGIGIPEEFHKSVFAKLFRAPNAEMHDQSGQGLSLYIVQAIVTAAGGEVSFTSAVNEGTTFTITLPASGMQAKEGTKKLETDL